MDIVFFASPAELRRWFEENHSTAKELQVGFYKAGSGRPSVTWPEAVDEALCFGWIDGVRKGLDDTSYTIRFTPRKPGSVWSARNIANAERLISAGRMQPAGLKAFAGRKESRSAAYSYEQGDLALSDVEAQQFRANPAAWDFFQAQAGSYQRACIWWVISAKKEETRRKRLSTLIAESAQGRKIRQFVPRTRSA